MGDNRRPRRACIDPVPVILKDTPTDATLAYGYKGIPINFADFPPSGPPPVSGLTFRAFDLSESATATTAATTTKPAGTVENDLLIAQFAFDHGFNFIDVGPAGWTEMFRKTASDASLSVWYKIAGDAEPASYSWTVKNSAVWNCITADVAGGDPATPLDSSVSTSAYNAAQSQPQVFGITAATVDNTVLSGISATNATVITPHVDYPAQASITTGNLVNMLTAHEDAPAGATGNIKHTFSVASTCCLWHAALKPAP